MRRIALSATICLGLQFTSPVPIRAQRLGDIIYTSWGQLCSVSADATHRSCLRGEIENDDASWRPSGSTIVVERGTHDGPHALYLLDSLGHPLRELDSSAGCIRPTWTPDGRYIYAINYSLPGVLLRWDSAGRARTAVPVQGATRVQFQMIAFSPSGKRAAILTGAFQQMLLVEVTGTQLRVLSAVPSGFHYVSQSVWLDDDNLVFVGKKQPGFGHLYELSVSTTSVRQIGIDSLALRDQLILGPDRRRILVTASTAKGAATRWQVWLYSLDRHDRRRLTSGTEDIVTGWR